MLGGCRGTIATMAASILTDAFAHHVWATIRLLDACATLEEAQLEGEVTNRADAERFVRGRFPP